MNSVPKIDRPIELQVLKFKVSMIASLCPHYTSTKELSRKICDVLKKKPKSIRTGLRCEVNQVDWLYREGAVN